jgi:hypothetical protein
MPKISEMTHIPGNWELTRADRLTRFYWIHRLLPGHCRGPPLPRSGRRPIQAGARPKLHREDLIVKEHEWALANGEVGWLPEC